MPHRPHIYNSQNTGTSDLSNTPAQGMFQSRPFVMQPQATEKSQEQPDLKVSLMRAERHGHHLSKIQPASDSATTAVQPKLEMGQPVQLARFSFNSLLNWGKRPQKPPSAKTEGVTAKDQHLGDLTAHHKYGLTDIKAELQNQLPSHSLPGVSGPSTAGVTNLQNWANPTNSKPTLNEADVAWASHNIFMSPKPEHRLDDPGRVPGALEKDLDTHFTASGTVTPKSELALHIKKKGGIANFDPQDLTQRLNALPNLNRASAYNPAEWTQNGTDKKNNPMWQQTGMPQGWHHMTVEQRIKYAQDRRESANKK